MELWIRSQNKNALVKVEILRNEYRVISAYSGNNRIVLGEYNSNERALEVLDEIQNIIKPKPILQAKPILSKESIGRIQDDYGMTVIPSCVDVIEPISTSFVYEMPKE